jgi:hypothetical protein
LLVGLAEVFTEGFAVDGLEGLRTGWVDDLAG